MTYRGTVIGLAAAAAQFLSCGGGPGQPKQLAEIPVPNNPSKFVFDIGYADQAGHYFIADRTNKSVDMFDSKTYSSIAVITGGFAGQDPGGNNDKSGPDGVVGIPGTSTLYVGDVSSVKIVDSSAKAVTKNIQITPPGSNTPSGFRADEGCYDPDDKLMMFAHPGDSTPFISWISTDTQAVVTQLALPGSMGLEQYVYDPGTKSFLINNDGTFGDGQNPGREDCLCSAEVQSRGPRARTGHRRPRWVRTGQRQTTDLADPQQGHRGDCRDGEPGWSRSGRLRFLVESVLHGAAVLGGHRHQYRRLRAGNIL